MFFFIYISFKGSQSLSNMRSKITAMSYLHSSVFDTAVQVSLVIFLHKKQSFGSFTKIFEEVGFIAVSMTLL
jgi:hypothetical protein